MIRFFKDICKKTHSIVPKEVLFLFINSFLSAPIVPIQLYVTKRIVDLFENWRNSQAVNQIMLFAVLLGIVYFINYVFFGSFNALAMTTLYAEVEVEKEFMILNKTSRLPMLEVEAPEIANKRQRALDFDMGEAFNQIRELIQNGFIISILLILLAIKGNFIISAMTCTAAYLSVALYSKTAGSTEVLARSQVAVKRFVKYLSEIMMQKKSVREIRIFRAENYLKEKWRRLFNESIKDTVRLSFQNEKIRAMPDLLMAVISSILALIIAFITKEKNRTVGDFVLLFQGAMMLYSTLPLFISSYGKLKAFMLQWEDFTEYMSVKELEEISIKEVLITESQVEEILDVVNLSFQYPGASSPAINNLSFKLEKGCKLALVGENGSGKSTLIKLLLGLYKPDRGSIKWTVDTKKEFSAVFQDYGKYLLTVRENIALGNLEYMKDTEKLWSVLTSAQIERALSLDEQLGNNFNGRELSGGQWQKLAAARANLREGKIIFFDEPTAAMDPKAEQKAFKDFLEISHGKTAVLVTHRLGAARLADHILVIKEGKLIEQGSHEKLIEAGGEYANMYNQQSAWYKGV
jgi:ABC-type multidrug transport system fused ATPase/permease subunit